MEWATESTAPRSSFVTVLAWIYIALTGLGTFVLVLQNIVFNALVPFDQLHDAWARAQREMPLPAWFGWFFDHVRLFLAVLLAVTLVKLVSAIALLKRRNWARLVFIAIFALGILWNIGGTVLQQFMVFPIPKIPRPPDAPADFDLMMSGMMTFIRVISALFAIAFSVLFAWLIRKLLSAEIAAEFA
jgi:hypothetical protein